MGSLCLRRTEPNWNRVGELRVASASLRTDLPDRGRGVCEGAVTHRAAGEPSDRQLRVVPQLATVVCSGACCFDACELRNWTVGAARWPHFRAVAGHPVQPGAPEQLQV